MRWRICRIVTVIVLVAAPGDAPAQDRVALGVNVLFYGDNTEFHNPFRAGETLLGSAIQLAAATEINDRVTLTFGVSANQRFGSADAFELIRPVASLAIRSRRSSFVFGTLPPRLADGLPSGPDLQGPHGLLPPLQRETMSFERPFEAGLLWTYSDPRVRHEAWLNWQRLNTAEHRERFDAGVRARLHVTGPLSIPFEVHVAHEGGQLFASGPVADSVAAATGVRLAGRVARMDTVGLDFLGLASRHVPDRAEPERSRTGVGFFGRASAERAGWRGHLIFWRGCDFVKDEADPNYLSVRRDGTRYRGTRDYAEAGLTRLFRPAPGVTITASGRFHRIERHYEYSYRILGTVGLKWRVR